jgi:ribosomal-protein-alanine N-acetyltransferase
MTVRYDDVFDDFPRLQTDRLCLRAIRPGDADALLAYLSDEATARFIEMGSYTRLEEAESLIATWAENFARRRQIRWGIAFASDDVLIGTCGFDYWDREGQTAALSYDLARPVWGQGIMREALQAVIAFGFRRMGFARIEATVWPENTDSIRVLEKLDFQQDVLPSTETLDDEPLVFTITNESA